MAALELGAQWGLLGVVILAILYGTAWAGKRLLGEQGVLEHQAVAMNAIAKSLDSVGRHVVNHETETRAHVSACVESGKQVGALHRAALAALTEIESECKEQGLDISARIERVRMVIIEEDMEIGRAVDRVLRQRQRKESQEG